MRKREHAADGNTALDKSSRTFPGSDAFLFLVIFQTKHGWSYFTIASLGASASWDQQVKDICVFMKRVKEYFNHV